MCGDEAKQEVVNIIECLPSQVTKVPFIHCYDEDIAFNYPKPDGKWMMFFDRKYLDLKWLDIVKFYIERKLIGISSIKVSTNYKARRTKSTRSGVIEFNCGPARNEELMKKYGQNLLEHIQFKARYMYYKTEEQSAKV